MLTRWKTHRIRIQTKSLWTLVRCTCSRLLTPCLSSKIAMYQEVKNYYHLQEGSAKDSNLVAVIGPANVRYTLQTIPVLSIYHRVERSPKKSTHRKTLPRILVVMVWLRLWMIMSPLLIVWTTICHSTRKMLTLMKFYKWKSNLSLSILRLKG